ncbi:transmembrane protein 8A [Clonorchis sinensis]|uniref:Transmembrane protein 8A n=1 Tax=Clonorchis sinensis TaxID=79923 RepID=G7YUJ2_CLOSI|nr:transmembrane protein 8A [Clonorchis sinensis]
MSFGGDSANSFVMHGEKGPEDITRIDAKKDLGIWLSPNLSFSLHLEKSAQKAFAVLRMIRRTFSRITRTDFQILYGAYVRPLLEYANPVVYSGRTKDVILIERVQRAATKMVAGLKSMDYETRLVVLDLFPLEYRRLRGDLILTYALFEQGLANRFFTVDPANTRRGHDDCDCVDVCCIRFRLPNGLNSIDLIIEECSVTPTSVLENESFPERSASSPCPVLLDASRDAIPTALASHMRQLLQSSNSHSGVLNNLSVSQHSLNFSLYRFQGKRYRFDALQGSRVAHYLYLRNLAHFGTMTLRLSFTDHFSEYQPPYQNKIYSPLLSVLRDTAITNKTQASGKQATPSSQSNPRNLSLLSWVNANWPKLTMERRTRQMLTQRAELAHSLSQQDAFVDPELLLHKTFEKCSVWNAPSRVSMHYAFAYHLTYKPESGQYTNGLRIPPWHAIAIPFDLAPGLDTGGSLEVTLQLNPFDLMQHINHTHSLPLPRQVILHACLSRHAPTSPYDFISRKRCPLWLRLATHHGVAVSVAHAVFAAVSATLARNQPSHRSELPPLFDTSFDEAVDRSFLYLPYPSPGQWFLGLYAECYAASDVRWCDDPASAVDVGLVIQSRPCLNYRCRESGEGASLPPSRVLSRAAAEVQPVVQDQTSSILTPRWRPPWWNFRKPDHAAYQSPLVNSTWQASSLFGEGLCVELLQQSIFASTCACPPGRFGLGCLRPNSTELVDDPLPHGRELDELIYMWNGYSKDALLLALTNLAFVPGICLALIRRLWVPALAYTYTLVFSALYHLCDTDVMNIPARVGLRTISGGAASFGGYSLVRARGYHVVSTAPNGYHSVPHGFRFTSPACPLPLDILSFCDFFGGVLSVLVTMIAACACPLRYAQLAYVISMLFLSIAVQVARYSVGLFLIPSAVGFIILAFSWILRTRQTGRLFPPVQWWILSLFPGLVCAGTGYMPHRSDRADYAPDVQIASAAQPHICSSDSSRSPLTRPTVLCVDITGDNSPTTVSDNII